MSGNRRPQGPQYHAKPRRWGPAGWWCCQRLMVQGDLPALGQVATCRACGAVVQLDGAALVNTIQIGHPRRRSGGTQSAVK